MNKEYVEVDGNLIVSDEEADRLSKEIHNEKKRRSGELNSWEYYSDQKVKYDNFKGKYRTCDERLQNNKSRNEILEKVIKNFDYPKHNNIRIRKIQSAKQIKYNKNITQKLINDKVKIIINDLLSKDSQKYKIKEEYSKNFFPFNRSNEIYRI